MNSPYLTTKDLADLLHRKPDYIAGMKRKGYVPSIAACNLHTLDGAVAWLNANPDFRLAAAYPRKRKQKKNRSAQKQAANTSRR